MLIDGFATSIIYIVLKRYEDKRSENLRFATSIIYIVLKRGERCMYTTHSFCYQHNLHSSQTPGFRHRNNLRFCYQHNLHSSQTSPLILERSSGFATSIIYIVLKRYCKRLLGVASFATSIIYIVLKRTYNIDKQCRVLLPA